MEQPLLTCHIQSLLSQCHHKKAVGHGIVYMSRWLLGRVKGLNPLPEYVWMGSILTDLFNNNEDLTEAVVLALGQAVLFFGKWSQGEGLIYDEAQDAAFWLSGDLMWIGRPTVVRATALTVQEGHRAVVQTTVGNHGEARQWGHLCQHHITHLLFGLARGHNVWYTEQEERTSN